MKTISLYMWKLNWASLKQRYAKLTLTDCAGYTRERIISKLL